MRQPSEEMMASLLRELASAPESHASAAVRARVREFHAFDDPAAMYDCLVMVSQYPATDVSAFVRAACEVDRYYSRPGVDDRDEMEQACLDSMRKSGGMEPKRSESRPPEANEEKTNE